jgi:hypothetical protein
MSVLDFADFAWMKGEGIFAVDLICRSFHTGIKY